jgi:hypothetical protein
MMIPLGLLAALLAFQPAPPDPAPALLAGEAVKVDLGRHQLVVRTADPPREVAVDVDAARTRLAAGGRPVTLAGVRPGQWVLVAYEQAGAQRVAVLVKVGAVRPSAGPRR